MGPTWPVTILTLGVLMIATILIIAITASVHEFRKTKATTAQQDDLRQLVRRYEQLSENMLDVQQRAAADLTDLRARTAAIEQILRTVE